MADRVCWKCKCKSHMTLWNSVFIEELPNRRPAKYRLQAAFVCDNCRTFSLAVAFSEVNPHQLSLADDMYFTDRVSWLPPESFDREFPDVPENIAEAASEAYRCLAIGAVRAAAQLARSVVEASAKEVGIQQPGIFTKIEELHRRGIIREHIKEGAHEVRLLGNEMAHGDFVTPITSEESELTLLLMSEVLEEVFQSPARVARAREARLNRSGQESASP